MTRPINAALRRSFNRAQLIGLVFSIVGSCGLGAAELIEVPELGLRIARGFRVTLYAGDNLATDISALTIDSHRNVVVTGPGYVRTLLDRNGDGLADGAVDYASPSTGGMGLCFDGDDLMFVGNGALWRYRDADGNGRADGPPERLLSLAYGEHGGHAVRQGPDGAWYVIGGNDSKFDFNQVNASTVAARTIEGGALLRLGRAGRPADVVAHGFRNPYDFDFNPSGDIFTYDSDCERDYFLPWYSPTRLYHVAPGAHHGWRLTGYLRSWARRDYFADTVSLLADMDRGSPTGVACYNHRQFPEHYRGGLFALDWTFGRVYFIPLEGQKNGASYDAKPEVFLEASGTSGFAPTDVAVGYDGSLFISSGGRRSRGAVFRVQYVAEPARLVIASTWSERAVSDLRKVLDAPQPLEAWSRAIWIPVAQRLGADPFEAVAMENGATVEERVRCIEILAELFDGLGPRAAVACAGANSPLVRARTAWWLGLRSVGNSGALLLNLAGDASPYVRSHALASLHQRFREIPAVTIEQAVAANLGYPDKRVRQGAALLATDLSQPVWNGFSAWQLVAASPEAGLTLSLAELWRVGSTQVNTSVIEVALSTLNQPVTPSTRLDALRIIMMALGDYHLQQPPLEIYTGYSTPLAVAKYKTLRNRMQGPLSRMILSGEPTIDAEAARLLAVIEADDSTVPGRLLSCIRSGTTATSDLHFLIAFSRLSNPGITNHTAVVANALLSLDAKLSGLTQRPKQTWDTRLDELVTVLIGKDARLPDALIRHPDFARPAHVHLVSVLGSNWQFPATRKFLAAVERDRGFAWTEALIDMLSALPDEEIHSVFRRQLANVALRDRLLIELASKPVASDRDSFIAGLGSVRSETVRASVTGLLQLPVEPGNVRARVAVLRVLRNLIKDPKQQAARAQAVALLERMAGKQFAINELATDLANAYQPVFEWFGVTIPGLLQQLDAEDQDNAAQWEQLYKVTTWDRGDVTRGLRIFNERGCAVCHSGSRLIGPDLAGVAQRFSPSDLFNAIVFPSRDVAPAFRMTTFNLRNGESYSGLIAFESADGVMVHTGLGTTMRLSEADIVSRQPSALSFMPSGLLAGARPQDLADLHAYLKSLQPGR